MVDIHNRSWNCGEIDLPNYNGSEEIKMFFSWVYP